MGVTDWLARIGTWGTMLLPALIVLGFWGFVFWQRTRRRLLEMKRHEAEGTIGRASFFQSGDMPIHYDLVAHLGTGGPAATSLSEKILRPAIGVRLVVLGVAGVVLYYSTLDSFWPTEFSELEQGTEGIFKAARVLLPVAALYGVLYIFSAEARYDRDILIVTRLMVLRREYRWKNLRRIGDGGAYELILTFEPGGKAKVLKHSTGIKDFKEFALARIQKNRTSHA
jgi:hypothetical protein